MPKVLIEVSFGLIQAIYSDDPALEIAIIDWDTEGQRDSRPFRGVNKADWIGPVISDVFIGSKPEIAQQLKDAGF